MINSRNTINKIIGRPLTKEIVRDRISNNSESVIVGRKRNCDFCGDEAYVDGKTRSDSPGKGSWANMCKKHFYQYGVGLGTGRGQRFIYE